MNFSQSVEKPANSSEVTEEKEWVDPMKKSVEPTHVFKQKSNHNTLAFSGLFFNRKKNCYSGNIPIRQPQPNLPMTAPVQI